MPKIEYTVCRVTPAAAATAAMSTPSNPALPINPRVASKIFFRDRTASFSGTGRARGRGAGPAR
ncbi:hypothetical protein A5N77_05480 [Prescottella equi]|nr:hypothetical protein A5N77_05480 [Prescottella equi]